MRRRALLASSMSNNENGGSTGSIDINNYLTIVALEDGLTARLYDNACEYSINGSGNWISLPALTYTQSINAGQTLSFRGNLTPNSTNGIGRFSISKSCNLEGNCMSMLFGDEAADNTSLSGKNYAFRRLFLNCETIKSVSSGFLPATTLADYCYDSMFMYCRNLTQAPELPALILTRDCYTNMFQSCESLTQAPALPATQLVTNCYDGMFKDCSKLNYIKAMFTTTPSSLYTYYWVSRVSSIGKFIKNKNATWNVTGVHGIPSGWSVQSAAQ